MKKNIVFLVSISFFFISAPYLKCQTLLTESFTGNVMPPPGWTIDNHSSGWTISHYNYAGGTSPEGCLTDTSEWTDISRLISPVINTSGFTVLNLQFKHSVRRLSNFFSIGAATRSGGGPWHTVWSKSVSADIFPETPLIQIANEDVGSTSLQFCLFFQGDTKDLIDWYLDDIVLSSALVHDVGVQAINGSNSVAVADPFIPSARIRNFGSAIESFTVLCRIYDYFDNLLTQSTSTITNLGLTEFRDISFTPFILPTKDYLYKIVCTTQLSGDLNSNNDTLSKFFNTYTTIKKAVTVEIGTDKGCWYCPGAQMGGEDLISNGKKVGVIEYHGWGGIYSNPEAISRFSFYKIIGIPMAYFDGILKYTDGDHTLSMYSNYLPLYDSMYAKKTPVDINISGNIINDTTYALTVDLKKLGLFVSNNTKLFVALTESHIPCLWEGLTELNNCERRLLPDANGYPVDLISQSIVSVPFTLNMNSSWINVNCNLIAFIQDLTSKEIFNTQVIKLADITSINELPLNLPLNYTLYQNYPNPFNPSTTIKFQLPQSGKVTLKIFDVLGREVAALFNEYKSAGTYSVSFNASALPSGIYFYKLEAGQFTQVKKMILIK